MGKPGNTGIRRIFNAFIYSMKGINSVWIHEAAFRQEMLLFAIQVPAAYFLGNSWVERSLLIGSSLIVLLTELLNSAIEAVVDRMGTEHHELSGRAKDMGSAAVFISLVLNIFIWGSALVHYFLENMI